MFTSSVKNLFAKIVTLGSTLVLLLSFGVSIVSAEAVPPPNPETAPTPEVSAPETAPPSFPIPTQLRPRVTTTWPMRLSSAACRIPTQ